jgi:phosphoribosylformimino-5-aminoimidazole carboxamide ribotide isomerase
MTVSQFEIYPAIDLRAGKVVRLQQGDPTRQTTYADDPERVASQWLEQGAHWLHVVNLDGAFGESDDRNQKALISIFEVTKGFGAHVQFGGGLRSHRQIASALDLGVDRIVLGTLAVENPDQVRQATQLYGAERVAVGLDARQGLIQVRGWREGTSLKALELAGQLHAWGLKWLIFTDIARDGIGSGMNLEVTRDLARASGLKVIASGGVSSAEDVRLARRAQLAGIIIGRALYEGKIDLKAILNDDSF